MYHYVAFKDLPLQIETGSHTGDGWDDVSVTGTGFEPELVIVQADTAEEPHIRMRSMGARDTSMNFGGGGSETNPAMTAFLRRPTTAQSTSAAGDVQETPVEYDS